MGASEPTTVVVATANRGKLAEFVEILGDKNFRFLTLQEIGFVEEIAEDGETFQQNAQIKCRAVAEWIDANGAHLPGELWLLSDDSGLQVEALGGAPSVQTARFAGPRAGSQENMEKLLQLLKGERNRNAQFVCTICRLKRNGSGAWSAPDFFDGVCRGRLLTEQRGTMGFGYDPLFVAAGETRSFAEMSGAEKQRFSHRSIALQKMVAAGE